MSVEIDKNFSYPDTESTIIPSRFYHISVWDLGCVKLVVLQETHLEFLDSLPEYIFTSLQVIYGKAHSKEK